MAQVIKETNKLPEYATIHDGVSKLVIRRHTVISGSICIWLLNVINRGNYNRTKFRLMRKGVTFETFKNECVDNILTRTGVLSNIINAHFKLGSNSDVNYAFSASLQGREIAKEFASHIEQCEDWQQLCDMLHLNSTFSMQMRKKIITLMKDIVKSAPSTPEKIEINAGTRPLIINNGRVFTHFDIIGWIQDQKKVGNWAKVMAEMNLVGLTATTLRTNCLRQLIWDESLPQRLLMDCYTGLYDEREIRGFLLGGRQELVMDVIKKNVSMCKTLYDFTHSYKSKQLLSLYDGVITGMLQQDDAESSGLPESAYIEVDRHRLTIEDYQSVESLPAFIWFYNRTKNKGWDEAVSKMERQGITSDAFALLCARSIQRKITGLGVFLYTTTLNVQKSSIRKCVVFSESERGRKIALDYKIKILESRFSWKMLEENVGFGSEFQNMMNNRIPDEFCKFGFEQSRKAKALRSESEKSKQEKITQKPVLKSESMIQNLMNGISRLLHIR